MSLGILLRLKLIQNMFNILLVCSVVTQISGVEFHDQSWKDGSEAFLSMGIAKMHASMVIYILLV